MASLSIRELDEQVRLRLRQRAARNGRSMEAEIRAILTDAVSQPRDSVGLATALLSRFGALGGVEPDPPVHAEPPRAADLRE